MSILWKSAAALIFATPAFAKTIPCDVEMVARCLCPASMEISCEGGARGAIKDGEKLDYLKLVITDSSGLQRQVTLNNPPDGIRSYYAVSSNEWVIKNIPGGLKYGDKIEVAQNGYGVPEGTPLYSDPQTAENEVAKVGQAAKTSQTCTYVTTPSMSVSKNCSTVSVCAADVECNFDGKLVRTNVACHAVGTGSRSCPEADVCAADPDITVADAANAGSLNIRAPQLPPVRSRSSGADQ